MSEQQIFDSHTIELQRVVNEHVELCRGKNGPELLAVKRAENAALLEVLERQKRTLTFLAGEKIEPKTHFGEAVLLPVGGLGGE